MANYLDKMVAAYVECAIWSSTFVDDEGTDRPLDDDYNADDIHADSLASMREDCSNFLDANADVLGSVNAEQAGHDFWLTRNHHGAGFWDRGLGRSGDLLTEAAHVYGECDLYVGDDGKVYAS